MNHLASKTRAVPSINQIIQTSRNNEYALATKRGLQFFKAKYDEDKGAMISRVDEKNYMNYQPVKSMIELGNDTLIVIVENSSSIFKIDRKK